jgi:hypothetical protein
MDQIKVALDALSVVENGDEFKEIAQALPTDPDEARMFLVISNARLLKSINQLEAHFVESKQAFTAHLKGYRFLRVVVACIAGVTLFQLSSDVGLENLGSTLKIVAAIVGLGGAAWAWLG